MIEPFIIIVILIFAGFSGYLSRSLSRSGAFAAVLVGLAVFWGFGLKGLFLLGVFFATSTFWSKYKSSAKKDMEERLAKGSTRDYRQVAANGGAAALISIIYYSQPDITWLIGFTVCLASSNSDTWASEIGSLSKRNPVYIRTFKRIDKGTSGAISLLGSIAALLGSVLIATVSTWVFNLEVIHFWIIFLFGFIGNILDTIFGAYYQQTYVCSQCGIETEKKMHCHYPAKRLKGFPLVDNDMVNFLSGLIAAFLAMLVVLMTT
jgi:uncharacterized protein (TIGR00297 family)